MATNNSATVRAILRSIEVSGDTSSGIRSKYSVKLFVAGEVIIESTDSKPRSSVLKWEWNGGNELSFEPSAMVRIAVYCGFGTSIGLKRLVGQYVGKVTELFDNTGDVTLWDKKGKPVPPKLRISLSLVPISANPSSQANDRLPVIEIGRAEVVDSGTDVAHVKEILPPQIHNSNHVDVLDTERSSARPKENLSLRINNYLGVAGLSVAGLSQGDTTSLTGFTQVKESRSAVYEGMKVVLEGLYDCSDIFLPLKTAAGGILTVIKFIETVVGNQKELENLSAKLLAILSIVARYKQYCVLSAINPRIQNFRDAIIHQLEVVEALQARSLSKRAAFVKQDGDTIFKVLQNINSLCDVFQIDTQLNIDIKTEEIREHLNSSLIEKLNHEGTSYRTRQSSYSEPTGCLEGTRVQVLQDLEAWALDLQREQIYWMVGMAGVGKSTITQTFCEILEARNMLAASFFASRAVELTRNAHFIIPVIAYGLAQALPLVRIKIVKAIKDDPMLVEQTFINMAEQFKCLISDPLQSSPGISSKIIVIDALDECVDSHAVTELLKVILQSASGIHFKVFISSRDEFFIRQAFLSNNSKAENFYLHEIEKTVVQKDIYRYLEISLGKIKREYSQNLVDPWPLLSDLEALTKQSDRLFLYAATAVRYLQDGKGLYQDRFSALVKQNKGSNVKFKSQIDGLYILILTMACKEKEQIEVDCMRALLSMIMFLSSPLTMSAIELLSGISDPQKHLSQISGVIHIPKCWNDVVVPFHASFYDFITDSTRCSVDCFSGNKFNALVSSESHKLLSLKCLTVMNQLLKKNILEIPNKHMILYINTTNPSEARKIPEALKYSCVYWATHLIEVTEFDVTLVDLLQVFLYEHLLHWIECLSILGELQTGLESLKLIATALLNFDLDALYIFVDDARQFLQMSYEVLQRHCMEIYQSALMWLPKQSLIREIYKADVDKVPKVVYGLPDTWGMTEFILKHWSSVNSVAISSDGKQVVSGSQNEIIRIWNVATGQRVAELEGHTRLVTSVAFSYDNNQIASGSNDKTIRIWNAVSGKMEKELKGHTDWVKCVAFSNNGQHVASGSSDTTIKIWSIATCKIVANLQGHTDWVACVAFSPDDRHIVSGSDDKTIRVWNVVTCDVEMELKGHTEWVTSVAFSPDNKQIVSGSSDKTIRIWNVITGKLIIILQGHTDWVKSVAFSHDSKQVVSGSSDKTVRIWDITTGEIKASLEGHTHTVTSAVFSQDMKQIVSGSQDETVRIWNIATGKIEPEQERHMLPVTVVAFSEDGKQVASGSYDGTIKVWNVATANLKAKLEGHKDLVTFVAFSQDGTKVVSGSQDQTIKIWDAVTGEINKTLPEYTSRIIAVALSQDNTEVVFISFDKKIKIWNLATHTTQTMNSPEITLFDRNIAFRIFSKTFYILYSTQKIQHSIHPMCCISNNKQWIMTNKCHCWIPLDYQDITCFSTWNGQICLGHQSGCVTIVDLVGFV